MVIGICEICFFRKHQKFKGSNLIMSGEHYTSNNRCMFIVTISCRLRKLAADHEENIRRKDILNQTLTYEIDTLKKDADVQSRTLRELKEILQTHVKPSGPAQLRHRAGNTFT